MIDSRRKAAVVVGRGLFQKIERNRGHLGQSRFVESCVSGYVKARPARPVVPEAALAPPGAQPQGQPRRRFVVADRDTVGQIDRRRGALTRSDFIEHCLAARARREPVTPPEVRAETRVPAAVSREELREFQQGMRTILSTLRNAVAAAGTGAAPAGDVRRQMPVAEEALAREPRISPSRPEAPQARALPAEVAAPLSLRARITIFAVMAYALAWFVDVISLDLGGEKNLLLFPVLLIVAQLTPGISAVIMLDSPGRDGLGRIGIRWGDRRYIAVAYCLMLALAVATFTVTVLVGWGRIDTGAVSLRTLLGSLGIASDIPPPVLLGSAIFSALTVGMVFTVLGAFGEELGWRGYLLTNLLHLGKARACVVTGIIWGVWHAPNIMMGNLYPGYPYVGVVMITIMCVLLGVIFGWLRIASGSLWPCVVAHAALNTMLLAYFPSFVVTGINPLLGGGTGIIGLGLMGVVAVYLYRSGRLK